MALHSIIAQAFQIEHAPETSEVFTRLCALGKQWKQLLATILGCQKRLLNLVNN